MVASGEVIVWNELPEGVEIPLPGNCGSLVKAMGGTEIPPAVGKLGGWGTIIPAVPATSVVPEVGAVPVMVLVLVIGVAP